MGGWQDAGILGKRCQELGMRREERREVNGKREERDYDIQE
jgi:hypothetical protein